MIVFSDVDNLVFEALKITLTMLQYIKFFYWTVLLVKAHIFFNAESLPNIYLLLPTEFTVRRFQVAQAFLALLRII